ncbi:MAG: type IV toxin-antitoxin system AbiEi family antitoxin domain-containing protein [Nocardiopsaceae bacterium]|nr:type IV toxin-antitoxin system AbiEi family antitoxin domain-containing protein [Nocardiopsaceae bacterium]
MGAAIPGELRRVARYQHGVVSRTQAIDSGMPYSRIRSKVDSGRWQRIHRGVYATFTGPVSRDAQLWAAVLCVGPGAMLSHETAAEVDGLADRPSMAIHVMIPSGRRVDPVPGLIVHRTRNFRDLRFPPGELPRTWAEDTVLDLAETKSDLDDVCSLVTAAFGRHMVAAGTMRTVLAERRSHRWRREISELITAAADGAHSVLEFRYDRDVERAHGLPRSRHQVPFRKKDGSRGFRDRVYEPYGVIVELDGKQAHPGDRQWEDKERDNAAAADTGQSLRYGWRHVRWDPCGTATQVAKVLQGHGWKGQPVPCSKSCPMAAAPSTAGRLG